MEQAVCVTVTSRAKSEITSFKTLVNKKITRVSGKLTMADILDEVVGDIEISKEVNEALNHCEFTSTLSENENSDTFSIDPTEQFSTALEFSKNIRYIKFCIITAADPCGDQNNNTKATGSTNAFQLMMGQNNITQKAKQIDTDAGRFTAKDRLFNVVCQHLESNQCNFPLTMAPTEVKKQVSILADVLWYLDGNIDKFVERHTHQPDDIKAIPERFQRDEFSGFNDWKKKRKHAPSLDRETLLLHSKSLFGILGWKFTSTWNDLRTDIENLALSLQSYAEYLNKKNETQQKRQKTSSPPRQIGKHSWMEILEPTDDIKPRYFLLDQSVRKLDCYEYILFNEEYHSDKKLTYSERFHFIERLSLSVRVCLFSYCPGGKLGKICYLWKVPDTESTCKILQSSISIYDRLKEYLPEYHTRQMRQDFINRYCNLNAQNVPKYLLRAIYDEYTTDSTELAQNQGIDRRVQVAINASDPDMVIDLRHLNPGRPEDTFITFFECLNKKVEEVTAVDDRRHGVCHMSEYISVQDLISQTSKDLPPGTAIPSEATVLYAFVPKNSVRKTAQLYTSKVPLQFKVQARQLRLSHPDEHYCAAVFRYLKEYAVTNREFVTFYCVDDKCKVDYGEPGQAIQTGVRGKKSIVPSTSTLAALDHDQQSKASLTPSVSLDVEIPSEVSGSFYRGKVHVTYKDSVFQPSTPFRHCTEIEQQIIASEVKPVFILYSDGGPDHNLTFHSVKLSMIILFKRLGVDTLIACRTAPGHSWVNPAERVMSILNLALQNCALMRSECDSSTEQLLRSANSMSDIRTKASRNPNLKPAWLESVIPMKEILKGRTSRLTLKEVPFAVDDAAEEEAVEEMESLIQSLIDDKIERGKYQQVHVKSKKDYQTFLREHCRERHYSFQIKKCNDVNCCGPMTETQFPWLPDPTPKDDDNSHYKPFTDVVNTNTIDARPSASVGKPKAVAEKLQGIRNDGLVAQNVRMVVRCYDCNKPRAIYSKKTLSVRDSRALKRVMDKHDYSCGSQIVPEGDALEGVVTVRLQMSCETHVEFAYYASSIGVADVCVYCAQAGAERDKDMLKQFRTVLPVCQNCKDKPIPKRTPIKL